MLFFKQTEFERLLCHNFLQITGFPAKIFDFISSVRTPEYPAGHSDNIRPPKPRYPATLVIEDGIWWKHARMAQAKRDGDDATYSHLKAENDAALAAFTNAFKART